MVIYTKNENYKIWVNTKTQKFQIEMKGSQLGRTPYDTSVEAINQAEDNVAELNAKAVK